VQELLILRHGKSDWGCDVDDIERPLNKRGRRTTKQAGHWLQEQGLIPDTVITSSATRALRSAERCCKAMGFDRSKIITEEQLYLAGVEGLIKTLNALPASANRVMVVGHNPGLEQLIHYLSQEETQPGKDGKLLPTATVARLIVADKVQSLGRGCSRLVSITRPDDMYE